jgi:hypothetical protein
LKVPDAVGVPLIVIVFADHDAVTPVGSPIGVPIPAVATVVCVMAVSGVFMHKVGVDEAAPTLNSGSTVTLVVALVPLQPLAAVTVTL